ncbi:hypothetical protein AVEN_42498-1 [Araneus ventricosus]|uniref:CCHC-type domain-containing protein n=1 Tax=Araneus ventricosus TaxID=182803 RepID=A0A4Y2K6K4_ARAVE|nr:hypothetical protein AVEN_42498-1 [Araneus ventricosus]
MAFLAKAQKVDLQTLATEVDLEISPTVGTLELIKLIQSSVDYEPETFKDLLKGITSARTQRETEQKEEKERELAAKEKEKERENELLLKKMELEIEAKKSQSSAEERVKPFLDVQQFMPRFDPKEGDISLNLVLFERQLKRRKVPEDSWASHLLGLLPSEMAQLIAREPEEVTNNYEEVKEILMKRYKLSAERFRQMFTKHTKHVDGTWKDFLYELKTYFHEWIKGLEITTFEQLCDLMLTDQMKRRVPMEIKDHFIDEWTQLKSADALADKLDEYESVRDLMRRKPAYYNTRDRNSAGQKRNPLPTKGPQKEKAPETSGHFKTSKYNESFERKKQVKCFNCNSTGHIRPNCPLLKKNVESAASLNRVINVQDSYLLSPYTYIGKVNGYEMPILRDTGTTIDIVCRNRTKPEMLTGENIWVQQPFDEAPICLPLAEVELEGEFGQVVTKAAVVWSQIDKGRYLLGNRTAALLERAKEGLILHQINAIQTRAQKRIADQEKASSDTKTSDPEKEEGVEIITDDAIGTKDENFSFPAIETDPEGLSLVKVDTETLVMKQKQCATLKDLIEKVAREDSNEASKGYKLLSNGLLVKQQTDKMGEDRQLLVIPKEYREDIKALCHEGTAGHLGVTKTKDAFAKYFYWPKCYQDLEEYVKTCDKCQRVGKANEKKMAPMKLVPIIPEVFSKINVDANNSEWKKVSDYGNVSCVQVSRCSSGGRYYFCFGCGCPNANI